MISLPVPASRRSAAALAGALLLLAGCSGGKNKPILVPTIRAELDYTPPNADRTVYFANTVVVGNIIQMDVVIQDSTRTLEIDDVDLVLRYDASFLQVISITGQDTLFGTCNTIDPACNAPSPTCLENLTQANGGGELYCRSDGSTACTTDDECPTPGDVCGSFGRLLASFAVRAGPNVCTNNGDITCSASAECQLCNTNIDLSCTGPGDCSGRCGPDNKCTNLPGRGCAEDGDCFDDCIFGTCQGCPSVLVSGTQKVASLALRVKEEGTSSFRFVVSSGSGTTWSTVRKDTEDLPVLFFPNVDGDNPSHTDGNLVITGRL